MANKPSEKPDPKKTTPDLADLGATIDAVDVSALAAGAKTLDQDGGRATVDVGAASALAADRGVPAGGREQIMATVDSLDLGPAAPRPKQLTQTEPAQTVEVPGPGAVASPATVDRRREIDATIDSVGDISPAGATQRPPEVLMTLDSTEGDAQATRQLTEIWGDDIDQSKPLMTLKGKTPTTTSGRSTLVIQPRAFRAAKQEATQSPADRADYDLIDLLGEGGMGVVYSARQASIDRTVAIKMLKGKTADEHQRRKFLSEAVITGDLDHPNIVPIYDLGTNQEGALFYSMKRVQGTPWDERIRQLSLTENLEILLKVADAVAFAHSRGVIHRDLKPENTMLGEFGEVLVMDWGLALPTTEFRKSRNVTPAVTMGGTPAYMAPEMALGPIERIGFASDVYLLGAMLYEIITGQPPHTGKDVTTCLMSASKNKVGPTEKQGELVDIALQAMATDPADRQASVRDFQNAIRGYLSHAESIALAARAEEELAIAGKSNDYQDFAQAVFGFQEALLLWDVNERARVGLQTAKLAYARSAYAKGDFDLGASLLDPSVSEQAGLLRDIQFAQQEREARQRRLKTAKRAVAALVALVFLVVSVAFYAVNEQRKEAERQRQLAVAAKELEQQARETAERAKTEAEAAREQERAAKETALAAQAEERRSRELAQAAEQKERLARQAEEDAKVAALAAKEEETKSRQAAQRAQAEAELAREQETKAKALAEYQAYITSIGLAAAKIEENAFDAARELLDQCRPAYRNWEWGRLSYLCRQDVRSLEAGAPLETLAISADDRQLAAGGWNGLAKIWTLDGAQPPVVLAHGPISFVNAVAFAPGGQLVATGSSDRAGGYLRLWHGASGQLVRRLEGHADAVTSVHFSRDGKRLLTSSYDATARLWNVETGELIRTFAGHDWWVWSAAFSPDEQRIVTASHDGSAIVWTTDTGEPSAVPFLGHRKDGSQTPVFAAVFAPDGRHVASGGLDNCVLIWDPDELQPFDYARAIAGQKPPPPPFLTLAGHKAAVHALAFSRDGNRLVSGSHDNAVIVWDAETGAMIKTLRGHDGWVQACGLTGDGRLAVSASHDGRVKFWDVEGYEEARVLRGHVLEGHLDAVLAAAYSPDGRRVVTASRDRTAKSWDANSGAELLQFREGHEFTTATAMFFPDGKRLLTTAIDNTTRIWDVATGGELAKARLEGTGLRGAAAISHDGRWIVTGSQRPQQGDAWAAKLWSAADGKLVHQWQGHKTEVSAVAFSPDDRLAFSGDRNGRGVLWNRETSEQVATIWEDDQINAAAFLPDGQHLLTASNHNAVRTWQIPAGTEIKERVLRHPAAVVSLAVAGDGRLALTACADGEVRLWNVAEAKEIRNLPATGGRAAFAQNLRRRLQDYRWTVQQAAAQCQVSEALLRDLLAAKTQATPDLAEVLAGVFKCRPGDLWKTVFSVAIAPDGKTGLTVAADDRQVRLWNLADGSEVLYPAAADRLGPFLDLTGGLFRGLVWAADFSPQGDRLVTVGGDSARLWDLRKDVAPRNRELMSFSPHGAVASAEFSPDGKYLVTGSWDTSARVWDAQTGQVLRQLGAGLDQPQQEHGGRVNRAAFSPNGQMVLTASDDGTAKLWSTADWSLLRTLTGHTGPVLHAVFSHDSRRVLTASRDKTARIWDAASGKSLAVLAGHEWAVLQAAFSADGQWVVTGSADNSAIVWKLEQDQPKYVHHLKAHTAGVTSVAFSPEPEPTRILTGSEDYSAILWDAKTGQEVLTLKGHSQEVTSVAFSPDGKSVLSGSQDGTAILWLTANWNEPPEKLAAENPTTPK
ncbi:MAG: protein kinase [Pirellulaceae bacterium]|nr:protein kinase [Pirellulaceae bacterium]